MKYLKTIIFSALLGLVSASTFAMDSDKSSQWKCSLGEEKQLPANTHKQYLLANDQSVGFIEYFTHTNNCRYIANVTIFEKFRNKGIGSACMRLFIAKTKAEGFTRIQLFPLKDAQTFYDRLGFMPHTEIDSFNQSFNEMILDLEKAT